MFILNIKLLPLSLRLRTGFFGFSKLILQSYNLVCKLVPHDNESLIMTRLLPKRKRRPQPGVLVPGKPWFDIGHNIMIQMNIHLMTSHIVLHRFGRCIDSHLHKGSPERCVLTKLILAQHPFESAFKLNHTFGVLSYLQTPFLFSFLLHNFALESLLSFLESFRLLGESHELLPVSIILDLVLWHKFN